jgi:hypothetical protein
VSPVGDIQFENLASITFDMLTTNLISSPCPAGSYLDVTFIVPAISDQTYNIYSGSSTISIPAFSIAETCADESYSYTAMQSNGSALPSFVTFSTSPLELTLYSDSLPHAGTYVI